MIPIQFRTFFRLATTPGPMRGSVSSERMVRAGFSLLYPLFELNNALCLGLDHALFPFTETPVESPIFIISAPRSGSTVLHRIMAQDEERFEAFRLWESIFPALTVQYPIHLLARLDERLGGRLQKGFEALESRLLERTDRIHKLRLNEPEEDEVLFIHTCATELLGNLFPQPEILWDYRNFDQLPASRRGALMHFYRRCVQRHLYIRGRERRFLSKNPPFCHKAKSLRETFPDARFILLVRHPVESVCSLLSLLQAVRGSFGLKAHEWDHDRDDGAVRFAIDCYKNGLNALDSMPPESHIIIRYEDLVASPRSTVERIYRTFDIPLSPEFAAKLEAEELKARSYRSRHHYSPEQFGISHQQIEEVASFVYDRFGYPRQAESSRLADVPTASDG